MADSVELLIERASNIEVGDGVTNPDARQECGFVTKYLGKAGKTDVEGWEVQLGDKVHRIYNPCLWFKSKEWTRKAVRALQGMNTDSEHYSDLMTAFALKGHGDVRLSEQGDEEAEATNA